MNLLCGKKTTDNVNYNSTNHQEVTFDGFFKLIFRESSTFTPTAYLTARFAKIYAKFSKAKTTTINYKQ